MNIDNAIAVLDQVAKHWTLKPVNSGGERRGYECVVWAEGRRFRVHRTSVMHVLNAAIERIHDNRPKPKLKLVGVLPEPPARSVRDDDGTTNDDRAT